MINQDILEQIFRNTIAEKETLQAENAALKAKWDSVPWSDITWAVSAATILLNLGLSGDTIVQGVYLPLNKYAEIGRTLNQWVIENVPLDKRVE